MSKPKVLYVPVQSHTDRVFRKEDFERFMDRFDVSLNESGSSYTTDQVAEKIRGHDALVTGWGAPPLSEAVFENADKLRMIAHSAGSVKHLLSEQVVEKYIRPRNICVFSANHAIAYNVAEATIGLIIMTPRRFLQHAMHIRGTDGWRSPHFPWNGQFLCGSVVGVVSASKVGREVIRLLKPFDVTVLVYDPYLSDWDAGRLNVEKVGLNDLFSRSDIVTVHAPSTSETLGMIGAAQLKLLKDGATLVNTSRGKVIDHDALLKECQTGRILAALDVTDPEPLPADSPFRKLENVIITPHVSGAGHYGYFKIGSTTLQALEDFFAGRAPDEVVKFSEYARLA